MKKSGKLSFRVQLTVALLGCLFCSMVIIAVCLILNISEAERSNRSYLERLNDQWATELEFMTAGIDKIRFLHLSDDEMLRIIEEEWNMKRKDLRIENELYMSGLLDALCMTNSNVLRITVETASGTVYGNYVEDSASSVELVRSHQLYKKDQYKNEMMVTDVYQGEINLIPYSLLTFSYPLYCVSRNESLGTIYIDVDFGSMRQRFDAVEKQDGWSSFLMNENGVIYSSDAALGTEIEKESQERIMEIAGNGTGNGSLSLDSGRYLIHVRYMEETDWYLIQCVDRNSFILRRMRSGYLLVLWVIILVCILIFVGTLMMKRISAPIGELSQVMSRAATEEKRALDYMECREDYPLEMHEIAQGYNAMVDRIRKNIIQEYENELNQKKTELQMLQYQINPHFLYNTLNIMSAIARLNEIPYISDISESLSKLFFYNVKGGQIVTLREELDNLQNYIRIQMIRFPEKFEVIYQIESGLASCRILKFLLQPLVENAIDHGIAEKRGKGLITIEAKRINENEGIITIYDDGAGIEEKELEALRQKLAERENKDAEENKGAIGLRNVQMRVRNYYGNEYGITLESKKGCGTRLSIFLPLRVEVTDNDESNCG